MHISEIRIAGFTSYLDPATVSEFSEGVNVVVGSNGAGKSNFFAAVRFVLADLADRTTNDLLYNGRGRRATHSRVEIVLANAGSRFLSLGDEVAIGREIVNGQDRYLVNGKPVTKTEARALLDAAGLSYGGNAFFIVPQGDVTRLASASDEARLTTLLAASGAQTFEDRKQLARESLIESNSRLDECSRLLTTMEQHLADVGHDAESLREHLELRKQLRGIEHVLLAVEKRRSLLVIAAEDGKLDEQRSRLDRAAAALRTCEAEADADRSHTASAEAQLAEAEAELELAEREVAVRRRDHKAHLTTEFYGDESLLATHAGTTQSAGTGDSREAGTRGDDDSDSGSDMDDTESDTAVRTNLEGMRTDLEGLRTRLAANTKSLAAQTARLRALQLKEGRGAQLSAEARAAYREEAMARVSASIAALRASLALETAKRDELERKTAAGKQELGELEHKAQAAAEEVATVTGEQQEARARLSDADSQRAMAMLAHRKAEIARERLDKAAEQQTKQLLASNRATIVRSVATVRDLAASLGLGPSQYFGTVAELLDVQPAVAYAVDRVGGSQMFYHVVDSGETVERLVRAMEENVVTHGSATFVPLQDIIVPAEPTFPEVEGTAALSSMISVRDARFSKLVRLLFGRYVLCSDINTAAQYARSHDLPAVTVEGDFCDPRGAISGGSATAANAPRQPAIRELCRLKDEALQQQAEARAQRTAADAAAQLVTQCIDELNKTKVQLLRASLARQDTASPVMDAREHVATLARQHDDSLQAVAEIEVQLSAAREEERAASEDASFAGALTSEEQEEMAALTASVESLQVQCDELSAQEYTLAARVQRLQSRAERLRAAAVRHEAELAISDDAGLAVSAAEAEQQFVAAQAAVVRKRRAVEDAERLVQQAQDRLHATEEALRHAEAEARTLNRRVENHSVKSRALAALVAELDEKAAKLGSVPESALEQAALYNRPLTNDNDEAGDEAGDDSALRRVVKELSEQQAELHTAIAALGDVNQRAINDFEILAAELDGLRRQYSTLQSERSTIENTIAVLESQKRDKLDELLAGVGTKFTNVFAALSGNLPGRLVLNRNAETDELESIGLDVPFGRTTAQMSGGQKSLCALALIFAVQACDPAAFYIFDEIDANLDESARKRVAATVKSMSQRAGAQFICTTFRNELVQAGDAWFGVTFEGRESRIERISKDLAAEFVAENEIPTSS